MPKIKPMRVTELEVISLPDHVVVRIQSDVREYFFSFPRGDRALSMGLEMLAICSYDYSEDDLDADAN